MRATAEDGTRTGLGFDETVSERRPDDLMRFTATDATGHHQIIHGEAEEPGAAFDGVRSRPAEGPEAVTSPE
ncbi:hypothetical protein [Streptomyces sp. NPDC057686]|uniref:hypothetical protein n=1 Tax=Streptomyces sp. NPDC057686 TaxID=3346212 RepID=UPI0036A10DED